MKQEDFDFFKENGYLLLEQFLSDEEVARFVDVFERERRDFGVSGPTTASGRPSTASPC